MQTERKIRIEDLKQIYFKSNIYPPENTHTHFYMNIYIFPQRLIG